MSHRRQTPEEHFAKVNKRLIRQSEMHKRFEETQSRKAKKLMEATTMLSLIKQFFRKPEREIQVKDKETKQ